MKLIDYEVSIQTRLVPWMQCKLPGMIAGSG